MECRHDHCHWEKKKHLNTTYLDETGEGGYIIADTTAMRMIHQWVADSIYDIVPVCGGAFNTFWRMNEIEFDRLFIVGITFYDWGPYQAKEMGIPFTHNELYASDSDLCHRLMAYYDEFNQMPAFNSLFIGNFCVIETTRQLLKNLQRVPRIKMPASSTLH